MLRQVLNQKHLEKAIHDTFSHENIITNARKPLDIRSESTDHYLEVDILVPRLQLGFEFQDFYHYATTWYYQNSVRHIQIKDATKRGAVSKRGISLITVPCWWDASRESLIAAINFQRPDVLDCADPDDMIPLNPPEDFFDTWDVPEVGEIMLCSFAESPESIFDYKKYWWLGEKYDGIRCLWNQCDLYTRKGTMIELPPNHLKLLVATHSNFDSEIWYGRGLYHEVVPVLQAESPDWSHFRIIAFDNPSPLLQREPLEGRYECVMAAFHQDHQFLILPARIGCASSHLLTSMLQRILEKGGEGVIAQARRSLYHNGRSSSLVKFKAARGDMEALVVSSVGNQVRLQLPNGTVFEVTKLDFNLTTALNKGDVVTFDYEGRSRSEVPTSPKFSRVRTDVSWDDVSSEYNEMGPFGEEKFTERPRQFWRTNKGRNLRLYFENYAKKLNLDPLLPQTWYSISGKFFSSKLLKRGSYKLRRGGYKQALLSLFPEIGLDASKFPTMPVGHWDSVDNRKQYFDKLARKSGFDSLIAENWYSITAAKLESARGVLSYYGGSLPKALMHLYPNVGFDKTKFYILPAKYWQEGRSIKKFFDEFAQKKGFDPLIAKNWYLVSVAEILAAHKGGSMLKFCSRAFPKLKERREERGYWRRVLATAVRSVYPNIDFKIKEFTSSNGFSSRRKFFVDYAKSHAFDPLFPANWYSIPKDHFLAERGGQQVLSIYSGSVMNALFDVFPDIGLQRDEFPVPPGHWADPINQKEFFETFARNNSFDPLAPSNWYSVSLDKFQSMKGYTSVLQHFGGSIVNGLLKVYPFIGLRKSSFQALPSGFWNEKSNRREFFDSFATEHGFDALVADNWYPITFRQIQAAKGGAGMLKHYPGQSAISALIDVYPEVHFDRHKFSSLPNGYWENKSNRREYFDSFAREHHFDPLVPSNWLSSSSKLRERKSYNSVLQHYKGGLQVALSSIYGFSVS